MGVFIVILFKFGAVRSVSGVFNTDLGRVFVAMQVLFSF